jgi:hypothetical protein
MYVSKKEKPQEEITIREIRKKSSSGHIPNHQP